MRSRQDQVGSPFEAYEDILSDDQVFVQGLKHTKDIIDHLGTKVAKSKKTPIISQGQVRDL